MEKDELINFLMISPDQREINETATRIGEQRPTETQLFNGSRLDSQVYTKMKTSAKIVDDLGVWD